jgi:hypothetical protein
MQLQLQVSYIVHLNSGSPDLKLVALGSDNATVEWQTESGLERMTLPAVCFRAPVAKSRDSWSGKV